MTNDGKGKVQSANSSMDVPQTVPWRVAEIRDHVIVIQLNPHTFKPSLWAIVPCLEPQTLKIQKFKKEEKKKEKY